MKQNVENRNQAVNSQEGNVKLKDGGFISMLLNEVKDLLKHPKKLLPTICYGLIRQYRNLLHLWHCKGKKLGFDLEGQSLFLLQ